MRYLSKTARRPLVLNQIDAVLVTAGAVLGLISQADGFDS
ncbi:hypothetical protein VPHD260_0082 [Vibrio phage D260]